MLVIKGAYMSDKDAPLASVGPKTFMSPQFGVSQCERKLPLVTTFSCSTACAELMSTRAKRREPTESFRTFLAVAFESLPHVQTAKSKRTSTDSMRNLQPNGKCVTSSVDRLTAGWTPVR